MSRLRNKQKISFLCYAASLPAYTVDAIPVYYFGRAQYHYGERTFAPWVISIYNDEDFLLRDFFEAWSNRINSIVGNTALDASPASYKAEEVSVIQYGKDGTLLRAYKFHGMWPSAVSDVALSWDRGNSIENFDVRLVYDWAQPAGEGDTDAPQIYPASYESDIYT